MKSWLLNALPIVHFDKCCVLENDQFCLAIVFPVVCWPSPFGSDITRTVEWGNC